MAARALAGTGSSAIQDEINKAHKKASVIWQDDRLLNFLAKYKTELFEALMDFVGDPNYLTLEYLSISLSMNLRLVNGRLTPERFQGVMDHIDTIDDMRAIHLA